MAQQTEMNLRALTERLREKARRKVPEADVEDLVQDVLVVLVEKAQSNQISAIQPYAEGILRHLIYDYYQKRAEHKVPLDGKDAESLDVSPEQRVFWQRHLRVVREVSRENPVDEALLHEHFLSGAPLREVASELGVSAGVVNGRLFRFRQKLLQRVGQLFTVSMALGVGLWSRASRALFVGRLHHATSWTVALLSVTSAGTWWAQYAPEKRLGFPSASQTSFARFERNTIAKHEGSLASPPLSKPPEHSGGISLSVGSQSSLFFRGRSSASVGEWGWWGAYQPSPSRGLSEASPSTLSSSLHPQNPLALANFFSGAAFLTQSRSARSSRFEPNDPSFAMGGTHATTGRDLPLGRTTASRDGQTSSDPQHPNTQTKEPLPNQEPKSSTKEPQNPNNPTDPVKPTDPKHPTNPNSSDARQSFCIKRDGRLYRCDQGGQLGEDVSGGNQSSFQCGGDTSCRRMVNGEQAGESPVGPALIVGQQKALIVAGENRYRESYDQGRTWSDPETPPQPDALLKQAVFVLNQRGEIWQRDIAKQTWALLRSAHENAELRVHLDARGGLCFEDSVDFRYEPRITGIDPVATPQRGGLNADPGFNAPKMPTLRPLHIPDITRTTLPSPTELPQGLPLPLPAPQKQTTMPVLPH